MLRLKFEPRFSLPVNGTLYTVGLGTRESFDGLGKVEGEQTEGVTSPSQGVIAIADDVPDHRRFTVFCHELVHAAFGEGASMYPSLALCEKDRAGDSEENIASFLGPIIAVTFAGTSAIEKLLAGPIGKKAAHTPKERTKRTRKGSSRLRRMGRRNKTRRA